MDRKEDYFDMLMGFSRFRLLHPFYNRYRKLIRYLFFGVLATIVNIITFWLATWFFQPLIANIIAWVISVAFAYFTNRIWVFESKAKNIWSEVLKFVTGRIGTLIMEEIILWLGIEVLGIGSMIVKVAGQVAVVIGNYVISKYMVFK